MSSVVRRKPAIFYSAVKRRRMHFAEDTTRVGREQTKTPSSPECLSLTRRNSERSEVGDLLTMQEESIAIHAKTRTRNSSSYCEISYTRLASPVYLQHSRQLGRKRRAEQGKGSGKRAMHGTCQSRLPLRSGGLHETILYPYLFNKVLVIAPQAYNDS